MYAVIFCNITRGTVVAEFGLTVTFPVYVWYPASARVMVCVPDETVFLVTGVVPSTFPSRFTLAPWGFELTVIVPVVRPGITGVVVVGRTHGTFVTTTFGVVVGEGVVGRTNGVVVTTTFDVVVGAGVVGRTNGVVVTSTFGVVEGTGLMVVCCSPCNHADICELSYFPTPKRKSEGTFCGMLTGWEYRYAPSQT